MSLIHFLFSAPPKHVLCFHCWRLWSLQMLLFFVLVLFFRHLFFKPLRLTSSSNGGFLFFSFSSPLIQNFVFHSVGNFFPRLISQVLLFFHVPFLRSVFLFFCIHPAFQATICTLPTSSSVSHSLSLTWLLLVSFGLSCLWSLSSFAYSHCSRESSQFVLFFSLILLPASFSITSDFPTSSSIFVMSSFTSSMSFCVRQLWGVSSSSM